MIEAKVEGQEVAAALAGADLEPLPLVEIVPKEGIYDYAARYTAGATEYFCPARTSEGASAGVAEAASTAASALRLRDLTRVDLIVDRSEQPWVLEVNVSPGMTETSLVPMAAQARGLTLSDLCDIVLRSVFART